MHRKLRALLVHLLSLSLLAWYSNENILHVNQRSAIPGIGIEVLTLGPVLVLVLGIDLGILAVLVLVLGIALSLLEVLVLVLTMAS